MFPRLLFALALSLACAGCDDLFGISSAEPATLRLLVSGANNRDGFNSLGSHQGLAGLHVTLTGAVERTFTAENFPVDDFPVPDHGRVFVETSVLNMSGDTIARVAGDWPLEPDISWTLAFTRRQDPGPPNSNLDPRAGCQLFGMDTGCRRVWYSNKIAERYRNREHEVLQMVVWRGWRCSEGAVC